MITFKELINEAASLVSSGEADVVMKGIINTKAFLKAILTEKGLRRTGLLSHLAANELVDAGKSIVMVFRSDSAEATLNSIAIACCVSPGA